MKKIEKNPFNLFDSWFKEAKKKGINEPESLNLATSTKDGRPSNRMVLMKNYDKRGFVFFTNLQSRKGREIKENPFAAMCFFWPETNKQIRIEGRLEQILDKDADDYFKTRPINSQIGATISKQSQPINENDFDLFKNSVMKSFKLLATKGDIKRPEFWSGFTLIPDRIEFWQRGDFRIHKRISYSRNKNKNKDNINDAWDITFLYP